MNSAANIQLTYPTNLCITLCMRVLYVNFNRTMRKKLREKLPLNAINLL